MYHVRPGYFFETVGLVCWLGSGRQASRVLIGPSILKVLQNGPASYYTVVNEAAASRVQL